MLRIDFQSHVATSGARSYPLAVADKGQGDVIVELPVSDETAIGVAVDRAHSASKAPLTPYKRFEVLRRASEILAAKETEVARLHSAETGFTLHESATDIRRAIQTLLTSGEEAKRISGEMVPVEAAPGAHQRLAFTIRHPVGSVFAVTPFNSPLNTVLHKVAPALAAGNSVLLKPSSLTPLSALVVREFLIEAGLPPDFLSILIGNGRDIATRVLASESVRFVAFTGSIEAGLELQRLAGLRRTQMELGSVSITVVCEDADLASVIADVTEAGFRKAGQVCTSVQRLLVHRSVFSDVLEGLKDSVGKLRVGYPLHASDVDMGPMISAQEAQRVEEWITEAASAGASVFNFDREGAYIYPTIVTDAPRESRLVRDEIFGPVVVIEPFDHFEDALSSVNESRYGLATGLYTRDWARVVQAARSVRVGVLQVGKTSSSRVDLMPYGGLKDSGFGKEGPRYAIREMTDESLIVLNP